MYLSGKDDVLDIEIDSYIHCISAFVKLAQSEYALLTEIIPEHHQKKTFDSLIQVRQRNERAFLCGGSGRRWGARFPVFPSVTKYLVDQVLLNEMLLM